MCSTQCNAWKPAWSSPPPPAKTLAGKRTPAAVVRNLDRVELFGADIPPEGQRNLLSEAFVTLNIYTECTTGSASHLNGNRRTLKEVA